MFIFTSTQKRCNPEASYEAEDGTRYAKVPRELLTEIPDPTPPADYSDETYYRTEQDDAPYVIYTKKSEEQLAQLADSKAYQAAIKQLLDTDYLFSVDRHANLVAEEPEREAALKAQREASRAVIRAYKAKYPTL